MKGQRDKTVLHTVTPHAAAGEKTAFRGVTALLLITTKKSAPGVFVEALLQGVYRVKELARGQNGDVAKGVQHEQIVIATDKARRLATHGQFEELIVFGVAAVANAHRYRCWQRITDDTGKEFIAISLIEIALEPRPSRDFLELKQRTIRY